MNNATSCSVVAIIGAPNAGKSTLVNHLVGQKVSIVTPKIQTTRTRITGIAIEGDTQLIFLDTPGVFLPKSKLHKAMVKEAWNAVSGADEVIIMVDSKKGVTKEVRAVLDSLHEGARPPILVLNKIDKTSKEALLPLITELNEKTEFGQVFMISALNGDGVKDLKDYIAKNANPGPWLYPADQISNLPIKMYAAEETREKLFLAMQQEIPYGLAVETELWEETESKIKIHQIIYVSRKGHKNIVIGKKGEMIKKIGEKTRKSLQKNLGKKVDLFLFVKVKENWEDDKKMYQQMGLEFPG